MGSHSDASVEQCNNSMAQLLVGSLSNSTEEMRLFAFDVNDIIHDRKQGEPPVRTGV